MARRRWFGARAPEEKSYGGLVALAQLGAPTWGGTDYAALCRDGFAQNGVAHRCVRLIAEAAATVPLQTGHEAARDLIDRPNEDQTREDLFEAVFIQLLLSGNAYVEAVSLAGEDKPRALYCLRADRMRAVADARGWVEAWRYTIGRRERTIRRTEDGASPVLHLKFNNPLNDVYGVSPLAAARKALDLHNASGAWAKALIDNAARPSGALIYGKDGARMTPDQFDRLKAELEGAHTGAVNAGRPLLLEGGLDWKPMSMSPAEMDFMAARNGAARDIALAVGVPPQLLGIPGDNTYANYREANLAFWRQTVIPLANRTARALGHWLGQLHGEPVDVACDLDRVPALSEDRDRLWTRIEAASFLTDDEKRAAVGLVEPEADDGV